MKKMYILCIISGFTLFAQGPDTLWTRKYDSGWLIDFANTAIETSDSAYLLVGAAVDWGGSTVF
ncbi:MAG: hypothetical protein QXI58_01820 [Candidatus Micrarchaeia archaeon]